MSSVFSEVIPVAHLQDEVDGIVARADDVVVKLSDLLLRQSVLNAGSDVHFERYEDHLRVRYRIDGTFRLAANLDPILQEQLIARLKVMANLLPHRRDIPQEGRISLRIDDRGQQDFRISVIPTVHGEKAVVRIFDPTRALLKLGELGLSKENQSSLEGMLLSLRGMIIVTGPSSAGKTTTLYAALRYIHGQRSEFACIVSVEDPVEYDLGFVAQMEVNRRLELDFAAGLRALLRQDPEVIMVGEIRDIETCAIALRAGLTGHCVLTTIHSGSASEVLTRLLDMGMEPFVVASSVSGVLAQRLVRKVCTHCKAPYVPRPEVLARVEAMVPVEVGSFVRGEGCERCDGTGYRGRTLITELIEMSEPLRAAVLEKRSTATLRGIARGAGSMGLLEDGVRQVREGITTLEEVMRVLGTSGQGRGEAG